MQNLAFSCISVLIPTILLAGVSSNPFLRPGSSKQPLPPPKSVPPPPVKITNAQKEVEFRGYFILNGDPYFCIFNKKSGHAEWLAVSESSYESYLVEEFDIDSEKLTLSFEGQLFPLTLMDSKAGGSGGSSIKSNQVRNPSPSNASPSKQVTRFMPPRPKTTPSLPDWLSKKREDGKVSTSKPFSQSYPGAVPRRTAPSPFFRGLPTAGQALNNPGSVPVASAPTPFNGTASATTSSNVPEASSPSINVQKADSVSSTNSINVTATSDSGENLISLENLPPPPPPPNILPPSPPPDIQPSRDE